VRRSNMPEALTRAMLTFWIPLPRAGLQKRHKTWVCKLLVGSDTE
jgi:hypothetical protein